MTGWWSLWRRALGGSAPRLRPPPGYLGQDEGARRLRLWLTVVCLALAGPVAAEGPEGEEAGVVGFEDWKDGFRDRALAAGVRPETVEAALPLMEQRPEIIERDRNQSEFGKTIWEYLETAVSQARIDLGQRALRDHAGLFDRIEAAYGVDRQIVAAIWGVESSYGSYRGDVPTLAALATLAHDPRRSRFFEGQLIGALQILDRGAVTPDRMVGSWAGAMGHTQFMPTSWLAHAVDFTGDGRADVWGEDPADALASTAAYLAGYGWTPGQPWGVEVTLPEGFDYNQARDTNRQAVAYWQGLGVRLADGGDLPDHGSAVVLLPAGHEGAAFLTFRNFTVLERYNTADAYVIAVGHLGDRLLGGPPLRGDWPRGDRALLGSEREELQRLLTEAGFTTLGIDGLVGPNTVSAIRAWQRANGAVPDGYASIRLLERLRAEAP